MADVMCYKEKGKLVHIHKLHICRNSLSVGLCLEHEAFKILYSFHFYNEMEQFKKWLLPVSLFLETFQFQFEHFRIFPQFFKE